jgi:hypothetical protein
MLHFCAAFNAIVGLLGVLFCVGFSLLAIGLGGGVSPSAVLEVSLVMGPMGIAGVLYCWSGVALWKSLPSVPRTTVVLIGIAWVLCLIYCTIWVAMWNGQFGVGGQPRRAGDPYDEEIVLFVFIPMAVLLLVAIEFEYLRRKSNPPA